MLEISNNIIQLTRGDTAKFLVTLKNANGTTYTPQAGDSIHFFMKRKYSDANPVLVKTIPNDTLLLEIEPTDTATLAYGIYVFDLEMKYADGVIDTFIQGKIILNEEVGTWSA